MFKIPDLTSLSGYLCVWTFDGTYCFVWSAITIQVLSTRYIYTAVGQFWFSTAS